MVREIHLHAVGGRASAGRDDVGLDTDTFTVRVSDGQTFTDVPVTVVVRPVQLAGAHSVDVGPIRRESRSMPDGSRAYVTNQYDTTVSVIDTSTGAVLYTIELPYAHRRRWWSVLFRTRTARMSRCPSRCRGDRHRLEHKVVDINTTTSTVDVIKVGASPSGLAINPTGTRLYVSNGGSNTVSVVDPTTNLEITKVTVGLQPSGLAVSPDGTRLYALNRSRQADRVQHRDQSGDGKYRGRGFAALRGAQPHRSAASM